MSLEAFYRNSEVVDPDKHIIATYHLESKTSLAYGAEEIAASQSVGSVEFRTKYETPQIIEKHGGKIIGLYGTGKEGVVQIAFPAENINPDVDGIPQLMVVLAGGAFDITDLENARLLDFRLPESFVKAFPGPKFGINGVREIIGSDAEDRPLLGAIVKPKLGLPPKTVADICYEVSVGGVDFIKDDEIMANPKICPLEERVVKVMEALDKAREETGKPTLYAPCITSSVKKLFEQAEKAIKLGANALMFNAIYTGFSALQALAEDPSINVPIYVHRAGATAFVKNPKHGIDFSVVCKLARLAGGDIIRTGMIGGYIDIPVPEVLKYVRTLRDPYHNLKPMIAGMSGGAHPGNVKPNVDVLGNEFMILSGGGIMSHPQGVAAGARAMKLAIDAAVERVPIEQVAKEHPEVKVAIEKYNPN